jgi:hypothetical protein
MIKKFLGKSCEEKELKEKIATMAARVYAEARPKNWELI